MEVIKHKGIRIHIGCGGEVVKGLCIKCGERQEKKGLGGKVFGEGPLIIRDKDVEAADRKAHRDRIREGRDIFGR